MSHLQLDDQQLLDTPDDQLSQEQWERKRALERAQYETWDEDRVRAAYREVKATVSDMITRQVPSSDPEWILARRQQLDLSRLMVERGWRI